MVALIMLVPHALSNNMPLAEYLARAVRSFSAPTACSCPCSECVVTP
ncbi:hypothetical protein [Duganella sp. P38]